LSEGFVGAEIEQAVIAALYEAFFRQRDVEPSDFENAIKSTVPLSVTQKEQIMQLRQWADLRAVSATRIDDLKSYKSDSSEQDINAHRGGRVLDY
jgi:SpoVK/Ycf46/Vps4 family AAA+-type ATPase